MSNYPLDTILIPMGAKEVKDTAKLEALWDDPKYIVEEKYDGSRYVSVGGRMFSRRVSDVTGLPVEKTENIPHITSVLSKYPNLILDGEVYYPGMTSNEVTSIMGASSDKARWRQGFGQFQAPFNAGAKGKWRMDESQEWVTIPKKEIAELSAKRSLDPLLYVAFDILRDFDGTWLTELTWIERRKKLINALAVIHRENANYEGIIHISHVEEKHKRAFYNSIMQQGGEGVMLKDINGKYFPDKKPMWNWVKVKKHITVDVVIMGFKPAVREYTGEELETWQYWEDNDGIHKYTRSELVKIINANGEFDYEAIQTHIRDFYKPITKFYYYDWIGAVTFGQWGEVYIDPDGNKLTKAQVEKHFISAIEEGYSMTFDEFVDELYCTSTELVELGYFSGINEELRADMTNNPSKYIGECVEIGAMEKTKDGFYRHPQFSRLRPDKNPSECVIEE